MIIKYDLILLKTFPSSCYEISRKLHRFHRTRTNIRVQSTYAETFVVKRQTDLKHNIDIKSLKYRQFLVQEVERIFL